MLWWNEREMFSTTTDGTHSTRVNESPRVKKGSEWAHQVLKPIEPRSVSACGGVAFWRVSSKCLGRRQARKTFLLLLFLAMGESAHINGLASSLTTVVSVVIILLVAFLALLWILIFKLLIWVVRRWDSNATDLNVNTLAAQYSVAIEKLPTRVVAADEKFECIICLEMVAAGERLKTLPCGHAFRETCIDAWLTSFTQLERLAALERPCCPLCKREPFDKAIWLVNNDDKLAALGDALAAREPTRGRRRRWLWED